MIPNGLNPHGLENKTLTFSVLENGIPTYTCDSQNRLYCWATFPQEFVDYIHINYSSSEDNIGLSVEIAPDEGSWGSITKYVDKFRPGNHFMVHGNQTFYYQVWNQSATIADFASVYVLDTSGSMGTDESVDPPEESTKDKTQVKYGIIGEIYDYNCYPETTNNSQVFIYSASFLKQMSVSDAILGSLRFGDATSKEIYEVVNPTINTIMKKLSGSESMITNLYYSISDFLNKVFGVSGASNPMTKIGENCDLSSATFILFTDESIFTSDTLQDVGWLSDSTTGYYQSWFANWQENSESRFPDAVPNNKDEQRTMCSDITTALKQMSLYYGVNFNWGLYGGLARSNPDKKRVVDDGTAILLNKCTVGSKSQGYPVSYKDNKPWVIPATFQIQYPHEPMCRISLTVPAIYINDSNANAFKNNITMVSSDKYHWDNIMSKFHLSSGMRNRYFAFRYIPHSGKPAQTITLPSVENMNLVPGHTWQWKTTDLPEDTSSTTYACGATYTLKKQDVKLWPKNRRVISFMLEQVS